jgi:hypothetical protein
MPSPKQLAVVCGVTAVCSSVLLGAWELAQPVFTGNARFALSPSSAFHMWAFGLLQAVKPFGFLAGLYSLYRTATKRGFGVRLTLGLAALAGLFYATVWIMIAATARDDAIYIGGYAVGSDAWTNGGVIVFWLAPIVVGWSVILGGRIALWQGAFVLVTGVLEARLFAQFPPGIALVIEGALWVAISLIAFRSSRRDTYEIPVRLAKRDRDRADQGNGGNDTGARIV